RRKKRRWIAAGAGTLVVAVAGASYLGVVLSAPLPLTAAVMNPIVIEPGAVAEVTMPDVGAGAVSVTGAEEFAGTVGADGILAASDDAPRPIASITKIITALVVLESKPLGPDDAGPTLTFSKADSDLYDKYYVLGAVIQPMKAGSTMSLRDALQLMLVTSATNYAEAVSTWAFGSQARFLSAARDWLARNGLTGTDIFDSVGMNPHNTSTPADLIALGRLAMANPVVASIVGMPATDVPGFTGLANTNTLLGTDGIRGIKTGTLEAAGSCLLFSAVVDLGLSKPVTITGVVLGAFNHAEANIEVLAIVDSVKAGFHRISLVATGDVLGSYTTPWGETADVVAGQGAGILSWSDAPVAATSNAEAIGAAAQRTKVGSATFTGENGEVTVPLVLSDTIKAPDAWWRITHPSELFGG
ncbi:MAG TPA: D-alanyl-D-alanine carboxypeptidase, partial [Terrimesophilobacter sp.]|nr:D-alanyl-D-alanine carboxypeptidase [Terrimesophilobacter sp.]